MKCYNCKHYKIKAPTFDYCELKGCNLVFSEFAAYGCAGFEDNKRDKED